IYWDGALWGASADGASVQRVPASGEPAAPVAVEAGAARFVASATRIYWIAGDHVSFIEQPLGGGAAPPQRFDGPVAPQALAVDDAALYWIEAASGVRRCPVAGCAASGPEALTAAL